jgi:hypothetical protein
MKNASEVPFWHLRQAILNLLQAKHPPPFFQKERYPYPSIIIFSPFIQTWHYLKISLTPRKPASILASTSLPITKRRHVLK